MNIVSEYFSSEEIKLVRDPIYKFIEIPREFLPIIDNALFQRLRWVSQLPLEQLVYPSAQHSRFEHSLGTMYLSMLVAVALLHDRVSQELIFKAINSDDNLNLCNDDQKKNFFVATAGLVGLLHDVGHAPFSHTLEDAIKYTKKNLEYHHEKVGYKIFQKLIQGYIRGASSTEEKQFREDVAITVQEVLNKDKHLEDLTPAQKIFRTLIDSALDVDKGDYVIRDSYHCGVTYGHYDLDRLWRYVRITNDYTVGVSPKGAVEAWSLKIARYRMYKNVYKHHVRNITDGLLIRILFEAFDKLEGSDLKSILPLDNTKSLDDEAIFRFSFWTDNQFLKTLLEIDARNELNIKHWIEKFMKRELPKRYYEIRLEEFKIADLKKEDYLKIKNTLLSLNENLIFIITQEVIPPVFTRDIQAEIRVVDGSKDVSLAEYLKFPISLTRDSQEELEAYQEPSYVLQIFAFPPSHRNENLKNEIHEELKQVL